jgi:hypothetical protein
MRDEGFKVDEPSSDEPDCLGVFFTSTGTRHVN